jgi:hypothetical protein
VRVRARLLHRRQSCSRPRSTSTATDTSLRPSETYRPRAINTTIIVGSSSSSSTSSSSNTRSTSPREREPSSASAVIRIACLACGFRPVQVWGRREERARARGRTRSRPLIIVCVGGFVVGVGGSVVDRPRQRLERGQLLPCSGLQVGVLRSSPCQVIVIK